MEGIVGLRLSNYQYWRLESSDLHGFTSFDFAVTNQTIFLLESSAEGDFFTQTCADWHTQFDFNDILNYGNIVHR